MSAVPQDSGRQPFPSEPPWCATPRCGFGTACLHPDVTWTLRAQQKVIDRSRHKHCPESATDTGSRRRHPPVEGSSHQPSRSSPLFYAAAPHPAPQSLPNRPLACKFNHLGRATAADYVALVCLFSTCLSRSPSPCSSLCSQLRSVSTQRQQ